MRLFYFDSDKEMMLLRINCPALQEPVDLAQAFPAGST
jgi:hypothetical protein